MALSMKTTILLTPELHERLRRLAALRGVSMGDLVRRACEQQYGRAGREERIAIVHKLAALSLPVGEPDEMVAESVRSPAELLP